jgi:threonylcarbamoyladenosine tRNA methylthiotransferase MtaB
LLYRRRCNRWIPGETDEDFLETVVFLEGLDISYLHVFTYSERANTPAAEMAEVIPVETRRKRNEILRNLSERKKRAFYAKHAGERRPVLFEHSKKEGLMAGFTDNYVKIEMPENKDWINQIKEVEVLV